MQKAQSWATIWLGSMDNKLANNGIKLVYTANKPTLLKG